MEYYYTPGENISGNTLSIKGDEAKHLHKVLRKAAGEEIFVTDGKKNVFKTVIESILKDKITCRITEKYYNINEPKLKIDLYQSFLKNPSRFEFVIEKSVELGVNVINPIITENVINKKRDKSAENKSNRWKSIALSAMKQSQRCFFPEVNHPSDFIDAVNSCGSDLKIIAHEKSNANNDTIHLTASSGLKDSIKDNSSIAIFIGPEGGFTDEEIAAAVNHGFKVLNLGNRKYRSETAAIAVMSILSVL